MNKPTVGRILNYYPGDDHDNGIVHANGDDPLAAIIAQVLSPTSVNLAVFDAEGWAFGRNAVPLIPHGMGIPNGPYCQFPVYDQAEAPLRDEEADLPG